VVEREKPCTPDIYGSWFCRSVSLSFICGAMVAVTVLGSRHDDGHCSSRHKKLSIVAIAYWPHNLVKRDKFLLCPNNRILS
jgi:hypothetical protein